MGMGPIVWTCLALTLHQGPVQECFLPKRGILLPIKKADSNKIREIQALILLVSNDKGKTWVPVDKKSPDVKEFIYHAPADGSYWFMIQQEDRAGRATPSNPERVKPSQAVIVDTTPPLINVTAERLPSGAIRVHWKASDEYPDPRSVRLDYHTSAHNDDQWSSVLPSPVLEGDKEFDPGQDGKTGEVRVRVQIKDQAGNTGEGVCVLHAAASTAAGPPSGPPQGPPINLIPPTRNDPPSQPNQLTSRQTPRPTIEAVPGSMVAPAPLPPPAELSGPAPSPAPFAGMPIAGNVDPMPPPGGNLVGTPPNSPALKIVKSRQVRIDFAVGKVGPSGLGNADVYVSFDRGASWKPMQGEVPVSLPPGTDIHGSEMSGSVGVQLPSEGIIYGFIVAVKSKAGLAPPPPKPGDPPQALIEWDNTPPRGQLYRPQPDPNQPNTLLLAWKVEDRNLGEKPITLEWAEQKDGPWNLIGEPQLSNAGQYPWRLPERLPPRVYLRLTMRDLAGNESHAQTDRPELIDLSVPQTRIIGIAPAAH
jgi:hypothetical protein